MPIYIALLKENFHMVALDHAINTFRDSNSLLYRFLRLYMTATTDVVSIYLLTGIQFNWRHNYT